MLQDERILKLSQKCNIMGCLTCYINGSGLSIFVFLDLKNASPEQLKVKIETTAS